MRIEAGAPRRRIRVSARRAFAVVAAQVVFWSLLVGPSVGAAHGAANPDERLRVPATTVSPRSTDTRLLRAMRTTPLAAAAPVEVATWVQTIQTWQFSPAAPDPAGITYIPGATPTQDRLLIADSEVEEVTGAGWHGVNLWQIRTNGTVTDTGTTWTGSSSTPPNYTKEPTGLGFDPATSTLFVSSDSLNKVYIVRSGPDGDFGTSDDIVTSIDALAYGSTDTEDPEFDPISGHLFFLDGAGTEVYEIDPGSGGAFGDGNDVMTHFDVGQIANDFEGLGSDPSRNTLLLGGRTTKKIYEITKSGALVRTIDASGVPGLRFISGLKMAPASDGSGRMNYWIADRQIDNGPDPTENDGLVFELSLPSSDPPPTVSVVAPAADSTVLGTITVEANASNDTVSVQFSVDGSPLGSPDTNGADGWSTLWDSNTVGDGPHTVTATATDTIGQIASDSNAVTVDNVDSPPTVTITTPVDGSVVSGPTQIVADPVDDHGVVSVQFFVDAVPLGLPDTDVTDGWSVSWDTAVSGDGPHTVTATATDAIGQTGSDSNAVTVDNTSPTVDVTSPLPGTTVSGTVTVQANADDGLGGVASVTFRVDGAGIGTDANGLDGWSVPWNTVAFGNGSHDLTAVATDLAGNQTTSAPVTLTVDNLPVIDITIASGLDDVEERDNGSINTTSTDLDLLTDGTTVQRAVGLRFVAVGVPQGATIVSAYVQFQADEVTSDPTTLTVQGQASDDAPAFITRKFNVTNRARTTASVLWTPNAWSPKGARGTDQQVDVAPVIQEIVMRGGWGPTNALVLIFTGSGRRVAESFEGLAPPVLHIEYAP